MPENLSPSDAAPAGADERRPRDASRRRSGARLAAVAPEAGTAAKAAPATKAERVASVLLLVAILAVAVWVVREALWTIRLEMTSIHARRDLYYWLGDPKAATATAWERARREALAAVEMAPRHPDLHDLMSNLYFVRSLALPAKETAQRRELLEEALRWQQSSLAILPQNPDGWAEMAVLRQKLGHPAPLIIDDWNRALAYGPNEGDVQRRLTVLAFAVWPDATPQMKDWVRERYLTGDAAERDELDSLSEAFEVMIIEGD